MKVRKFDLKLLPKNQFDTYFVTVWEYWLGIVKSKMSLDQSHYKILKILYLADFSTDWLTDWVIYVFTYFRTDAFRQT